jgi:hypothetical protein
MGVGSGASGGALAGSVAGPIGTVVGAGLGAFASIFGAKKQSRSADRAAILQSQADAQALEVKKRQAALDQQRFESTQHANYDQWAARERRLSTLGEMLGRGPRDIPSYVPTSGTAGDYVR